MFSPEYAMDAGSHLHTLSPPSMHPRLMQQMQGVLASVYRIELRFGIKGRVARVLHIAVNKAL